MHIRFAALILGCLSCAIVAALPVASQAQASVAQPDSTASTAGKKMSTAGAADTSGIDARARALVAAMSQGRYELAGEHFDARMRAALPPDKLAGIWHTVTAQVGGFRSVGESRTEESPPYRTVVVSTAFEQATLDARVTFTSDSQVTGLHFVPASSDTAAPSASEVAPPPDYADSSKFREREVTVGAAGWALPGTLTMPIANALVPAVVLVQGSGPNDRDETVGPNKPFRDLAWGLASHGIAVLRYDKRTRVYPEKMTAEPESLTVRTEVVDDVLAAVDSLRHTPGIDSSLIMVLGHSLGGTLVPRIGKRDTGIAGFIIMAGSARPLEDVVLEQMHYIASLGGPQADRINAQMGAVEAEVARIRDPKLSDASPKELLLGAPAPYWLDLHGYQPARAAKSLHKPILVLQGGRDYQVTGEDYALWRAALDSRPDVEFHLYPSLNHLFIPGTGKITPAEYSRPGNVSGDVVSDIARWVGGVRGVKYRVRDERQP